MAENLSTADSERLLKRVTTASVMVACGLIMVKLAAWLITGSVSILASLVDSIMDAGASIINLLAVRYSLVPPDDEHRFGHGKAQSVAGLMQATFIAGSGLFLILEAVNRLLNPQPLEAVGIGVFVMVLAIVVTLGLVLFQQYVIRRTGSAAIKADAMHYKMDLLTNASIIVALLLTQVGWSGIDPLFALVIAGYILHGSWKIGQESFHELIDRELPDEERKQITRIATRHPQVHSIHDLRTRLSGHMKIIQLHLDLSDELSLVEAHEIAEQVETAIKHAFPNADVVIHQDPIPVRRTQAHS